MLLITQGFKLMCVYFGGVWLGILVFLYEVCRFLELGFCEIEGYFGFLVVSGKF